MTASREGDSPSFGRLVPGLEPGRRSQQASPQSIAAAGVGGVGEPLPYLHRIQAAFGPHDISSARAFINTRAERARGALGAEAFTYGNSVALPERPALRTVAHEAAHLIQQRGGLRLAGGMGRVGDFHERQADAVADLVVQGRSAAPVLDQLQPSAPVASAPPVQLTPIKKNSAGEKAAKRGAKLFDDFTTETTNLNVEVDKYSKDLLGNKTSYAEEKALGFVEWSKSATRAAERYYAEWAAAKSSTGGVNASAFGRSDVTDPDVTVNLTKPSRKRALEVKAVDSGAQGAVDEHVWKATQQLAKRQKTTQLGNLDYDEHQAVVIVQNPENSWPWNPSEVSKVTTPVTQKAFKARVKQRWGKGKFAVAPNSAPTGDAIAFDFRTDKWGNFTFDF